MSKATATSLALVSLLRVLDPLVLSPLVWVAEALLAQVARVELLTVVLDSQMFI